MISARIRSQRPQRSQSLHSQVRSLSGTLSMVIFRRISRGGLNTAAPHFSRRFFIVKGEPHMGNHFFEGQLAIDMVDMFFSPLHFLQEPFGIGAVIRNGVDSRVRVHDDIPSFPFFGINANIPQLFNDDREISFCPFVQFCLISSGKAVKSTCTCVQYCNYIHLSPAFLLLMQNIFLIMFMCNCYPYKKLFAFYFSIKLPI